MKYRTLVDTSKVLKQSKTATVYYHAKSDAEAIAYMKKKWKDCPVITLNLNIEN